MNVFIGASFWDATNCITACRSCQLPPDALNFTSFGRAITPNHPEKRKNGSFGSDLTLQVAHLALGFPDLATFPLTDIACYPGAGWSLPIRSSIPSNTSLVTITSASWNTSLMA